MQVINIAVKNAAVIPNEEKIIAEQYLRVKKTPDTLLHPPILEQPYLFSNLLRAVLCVIYYALCNKLTLVLVMNN